MDFSLPLSLEEQQILLERYRQLQKTDAQAQVRGTRNGVLDILACATSYRNQDTGGHILRTTLYVKLLVDNLLVLQEPGYILTPQLADTITKGAKLHDIGKMAIGDSILLSPNRLSAEEFSQMKSHTLLGAEMIDDAVYGMEDPEQAAFFQVAKDMVLYHHEKWDGTGYPSGLQGFAIPLSARIMAIADVYDALSSRRPYKGAFSHKETLETMYNDAGHFDPVLLNLSAPVFPRFATIHRMYGDRFLTYSARLLDEGLQMLEQEYGRQ